MKFNDLIKNSKLLATLIIIIIAVLFFINPMILAIMGGIIVVVGFWHILTNVIEIIKENRKS